MRRGRAWVIGFRAVFARVQDAGFYVSGGTELAHKKPGPDWTRVVHP